MSKDNKYWLDILVANGGFSPEDDWIEYAKNHGFKRVDSVKLSSCPDCDCKDLSLFFQYIYYSNLISINLCRSCGLYFSDTIIESSFVQAHFEEAYKDEMYFFNQRKKIFNHISNFIVNNVKRNGFVLDVGAGKGHLLSKIKRQRPDVFPVLNDISVTSCEYAKRKYDFKVVCGSVPKLNSLKEKFSMILLIDVLYYEPEVNKVWEVIDLLIDSESGYIVIRIPNKLNLIKFNNLLNRFFFRKTLEQPLPIVKNFNPEHIFIFSKKYLFGRLKSIGFNNVIVRPSPPLIRNKYMSPFYSLFWIGVWFVYLVSFRKVIVTPSCEVIASKI